ncbi:unnamed protein product [Cyprideis torosa]|uniref:Thioredoxin domain-containing protein n=1 Tax=Cyprideis torosa TaxID=163714 RepID=A0A7R8W709_9CRUS|nr:unnamed protein product [Cyprideis torosa]CAG0884642.1 unnamed protein product [Cyprideis torosa]
MSSKKRIDHQLIQEIHSQDEWNGLCRREGLFVVDVYSEWAGPCDAMANVLRKIKNEAARDIHELLNFASAMADNIKSLKRYLGKSEPTWLFISGGKIIQEVYGANAPLLVKTIYKQLEEEKLVQEGRAKRVPLYPDMQLVLDEQNLQMMTETRKRSSTRIKEVLKTFVVTVFEPALCETPSQTENILAVVKNNPKCPFMVMEQKMYQFSEAEVMAMLEINENQLEDYSEQLEVFTDKKSLLLVTTTVDDPIKEEPVNIRREWDDFVGPSNWSDAMSTAPKSLRVRLLTEKTFKNYSIYWNHEAEFQDRMLRTYFPELVDCLLSGGLRELRHSAFKALRGQVTENVTPGDKDKQKNLLQIEVSSVPSFDDEEEVFTSYGQTPPQSPSLAQGKQTDSNDKKAEDSSEEAKTNEDHVASPSPTKRMTLAAVTQGYEFGESTTTDEERDITPTPTEPQVPFEGAMRDTKETSVSKEDSIDRKNKEATKEDYYREQISPIERKKRLSKSSTIVSSGDDKVEKEENDVHADVADQADKSLQDKEEQEIEDSPKYATKPGESGIKKCPRTESQNQQPKDIEKSEIPGPKEGEMSEKVEGEPKEDDDDQEEVPEDNSEENRSEDDKAMEQMNPLLANGNVANEDTDEDTVAKEHMFY